MKLNLQQITPFAFVVSALACAVWSSRSLCMHVQVFSSKVTILVPQLRFNTAYQLSVRPIILPRFFTALSLSASMAVCMSPGPAVGLQT